jgi:hypothetical protein
MLNDMTLSSYKITHIRGLGPHTENTMSELFEKVLRESMWVDTPDDPSDGLQDLLHNFADYANDGDDALGSVAFDLGVAAERGGAGTNRLGEDEEAWEVAFEECYEALDSYNGTGEALEEYKDDFKEGYLS